MSRTVEVCPPLARALLNDHPPIRWQALALLLPVLLLISGCGEGLHSFSGYAQGTRYEVIVVAGQRYDAGALQRAVEAELRTIDQQYSNYRADSVIERFNAERSTQPVEVGEALVTLIAKAKRVHETSRGCFDPTLGPLTSMWRQAAATRTLPVDEAIERARERVGLDRLEITDSARLRKTDPGLEVDLSGIAQGESLARLAEVVEAAGVAAYSIEIGGEVVVRGAKPGGKPWRIALLDPSLRDTSLRDASLRDAILPDLIEHASDQLRTVATSGTYAAETEVEQRRLSQIIDPETGRPVTHDTVAVTVVHRDPALADAWSTALLCLGAERGVEIAESEHIAALFVQRGGAVNTSSAWVSAR